MGKKGAWFSAIKSLFTSNSKLNEPKQNKLGFRGRLKHGSFIPRFREPSSIEKILGEVDQQHNNLYINQPQPSSPPHPPPPPPPRVVHDPQTEITEPPPQHQQQHQQQQQHHQQHQRQHQQQHHLSATRIQAAYRGYMARRNCKASTTGLVRLRGVVRGQHVKRQTVNAMKQMQLLVRVQTQIHSRRIQMLHNQQQPKHQPNKQSEMGDEYWDDSLITKEEREARLQRKREAVIKRDKAMAYAYSHQLWKATPPKSAALMDIRSGGYPWWWNRLERQFPSAAHEKNCQTPSPVSPRLIKKQNKSGAVSPMSSRSMVPPRTRQRMKYSNSIKDDDSLISCPAFSVPNYMSPTVSAKAKARPTSNPKDRMPSTSPGSERRFSFPPTPNSNNNNNGSSFHWRKRHKSPGSIGEFSMDSATSVLGRKAFNRFV